MGYVVANIDQTKLIKNLRQRAESDKDSKSIKYLVKLLFETVSLSYVLRLEDLAVHAHRVPKMIKLDLGIDNNYSKRKCYVDPFTKD